MKREKIKKKRMEKIKKKRKRINLKGDNTQKTTKILRQ